MIRAAIIDDGVTQNLSENWQISRDSIRRLTGVHKQYRKESHADVCYKIIQHYPDANSRNKILWYNIKILDGET